MEPATLKTLGEKLATAERLLARGRVGKAVRVAGELPVPAPDLSEKEIAERAENLRRRLAQVRILRRSRAILVLLTCTIGLALAALIAVRKPDTTVELELHSDRIVLAASDPIELGPVAVARIELTGASDLHVGPAAVARGAKAAAARAVVEEAVLQGAHPFWSVRFSGPYLRLATLRIGKGASIVFESDSRQRGFVRIIVQADELAGTIDTGREVDVSCTGCRLAGTGRAETDPPPMKISAPEEQIGFGASSRPFVIGLWLAAGPQEEPRSLLQAPLRSTVLRFERLRGETPESSIVERGRVRLVELGASDVAVEAGGLLVVDRLHRFDVRSVALDRYLTLRGYGSVGVLRVGYPPDHLVDRRPSWLAWLRANQELNVYLGMLATVVTIVLAILHRLKILEEQ
jgi:hypothetical protein